MRASRLLTPASRPAGARSRGRVIRIGAPVWLALGLMISAGIAAVALVHEFTVARLSNDAGKARFAIDANARNGLKAKLTDCPQQYDERALLACVIGITALAGRTPPGAERDALLSQASEVDRRLSIRVPQSGEARIAKAYFRATTGDNAAAARAISESYTLAPYSRASGLWRIWWGSRHWSLLEAPARLSLEREAIWYGSLGKTDRDALVGVIAETPPFVAIALRLPGRIYETRPLSVPRE